MGLRSADKGNRAADIVKAYAPERRRYRVGVPRACYSHRDLIYVMVGAFSAAAAVVISGEPLIHWIASRINRLL